MSDAFSLSPVRGTVVVRAGGAVIAETTAALEMREQGHDPVIYIPRQDIGMAFLDRSDTTSRCPRKGDASYFHIVAKSGPIADAAWSYEDPIPGAEAIKGHLAFYPQKATVEEL